MAGTWRTFSSWKAAQAKPASTKSLVTVLIDTPCGAAIRMEVRIASWRNVPEDFPSRLSRYNPGNPAELLPSQSIVRIWTRVCRGSLFIALIPPMRKAFQ